MPGTYIAVLDKTPFLEGGLRRARRDKCRSIVYGIIGETLGRETPGGEGSDES
jgi:hypothetical protein